MLKAITYANTLWFWFQAESGGTVGSAGGSRRMGGQPGADQFVMKIPNNKVLKD